MNSVTHTVSAILDLRAEQIQRFNHNEEKEDNINAAGLSKTQNLQRSLYSLL